MRKLNRIAVALSFAFLGYQAYGQATLVEKVEAKPGEAKISYEKYTLPNGLTVYVHEDHSDPIVHVEVTYKVGSNREHKGITGFAHFFEHMMFQGSKHVADEEHINLIQSAGGQMNGTTNTDRTNYFETVPSNMLETALWLEADRMGWLLPAVTQEKFESQRSAVKNEKEQNVINQPYALPFSELYRRYFYPEGHPYSWSTIGYVEDLDRVGVQDMKNFFMRWYGPNNAILVVAGDVNTKETIKMIEKYFGSIPTGQDVRTMRVENFSLQQDVFAQFYDNVQIPVVSMYYPSVPTYHRDEPALDMLSSILGSGRNSVMYQRFVKSDFALQASCSNPTQELAGEFQFQIVPNMRLYYDLAPGLMQTMVYDSLRAMISSFDPMSIKQEDLDRVKAEMTSSFVNILESVQGKASTITSWERLQGKSFNIQDEIDRYNKVTLKDLERVFVKYIKSKYSFTFIVYPVMNPDDRTPSTHPYPGIVDQKAEEQYKGLTYTEPTDNFDRSVRPTLAPAKPAVIPAYATSKMDNGLKIIHTKHDELPKVTMVFSMAGGSLLEAYNPKLLGLASITASMMEEGTELRTSEQISAALDKLGSNISFNAGKQSTNIVVTSLNENIDATLKILDEMLFKPAFKEEDLKRLKNQMEQNLRNADRNPGVLASKAFGILTYGENILAASSGGYIKTVDRIDLDDVKEYYKNYYSPSVTNLTIVGNITLDQIMPKLEFLKKWQAKEVKMPAVTEFPAAEKTTIYLIDKPGATQSQIMFGRRMMPFDYNGEYYKMRIANYALGGSFNSRINLNLREEKGYTYGARSFITGSEYPGYWAVSTSVKGTATDSALVEIYKEIKKYYETGITQEELDRTKQSLNQADALRFETSFQKAGFLDNILEYKLPENYTGIQNEILKNITVEEVNALAKKFLNPDEMIIVIVGDARDIKKALKNTGIGKVTSIDPNDINVKAPK
ncbi:MAG: insulinase family protein [Bacteroidetes bacterium]|nr:MAG: insulinase family protein [Bacteroidota bacterium]